MAKKRGAGEGSIHQRKDGRWCASINLGYRKGKRCRKHILGWSRAEVADKLNDELKKHRSGLDIAPEKTTVADYLTRWLEDAAKPTIRHATYRSYEGLIRTHIVPAFGKTLLTKLTPLQVQRLLNDMLEGESSPRTTQYVLVVLRRALGQALKWGLVHRNVAQLVDPPRVKKTEIKPLNPEQVKKFLEAIEGDRLYALYCVALATGMRQGELLALKWTDDVDLDGGVVTIRNALQRVDGKLTLVEPKSDRSRRTVALPEVAIKALRGHKAKQAEDRLLAGSSWKATGFVFTTTIGTAMDGPRATRRFQKILEDAGLPRQRFHDLRHAAASLLLAQNVHPRTVMEILGHSSITLTLGTYSHVIPSLQSDAAKLMDAVLTDGRS